MHLAMEMNNYMITSQLLIIIVVSYSYVHTIMIILDWKYTKPSANCIGCPPSNAITLKGRKWLAINGKCYHCMKPFMVILEIHIYHMFTILCENVFILFRLLLLSCSYNYLSKS